MGAREFGGIVVRTESGEPVTTSMAIAEGTGNSHESTIKLVRKYQADMEVFGPVGFEIQQGKSLPQGGFAQSTEYAVLNEQQSSVLITFLRNNDIVRAFKVALIKGFFEMRTALANQVDPLAGLPAEQRAMVALMVDNAAIKAKQAQIEATQDVQQASIKRLEANQIGAANSVQSFTAMGYSIFKEIPMSKIELTKLGRAAARISKQRGITIDHVPDSRFGRVGQYHITALDEALEEMTK